jgi:hypothetical protein
VVAAVVAVVAVVAAVVAVVAVVVEAAETVVVANPGQGLRLPVAAEAEAVGPEVACGC